MTIVMLSSIWINAQSFQIKDLSNSIGRWEGNLTYLDYSTGKPFTILANVIISTTNDKKGYIMAYEYPKEPHANSRDTTYMNGKLFGREMIIEFKKNADGGFKFITEIDGEDGNDHKKATLRHTYILKAKTYSVVKDVRFDGTNRWIKRNEYLFDKVEN
jgi:hypothetical protein